jgi:nucleotide-binding universal stress UspA family protein
MESAPALEKIELHRVLCAIDTEPHAASVLACAKEFAAEYKAELNVMHVCESGESREAVQKLAGDQSVRFEKGEIPQAVSAVASRLQADLLIIGRRGQTHTYPIIRQSPCPVISV